MSCNQFKFKQFTVTQEDCAMKVGTDGVLLGAWCRVEPQDKAILDIGTGTGVIALMLAQRTGVCIGENANGDAGAIINAVEIDAASARQAQQNFAASPWDSRLKLYAMPIQEFAQVARFDHIVSNPPYFIGSLASPSQARNTARHTDSLSYEELITVADRLLKPGGRLSIILPAAEAENMIATAATPRAVEGGGMANFVVSRRTEVHSTLKSGVKRILLEFLRATTPIAGTVPSDHEPTEPAHPTTELSSLIIEDAGPGTFSAEYRAFTRDFYLYF